VTRDTRERHTGADILAFAPTSASWQNQIEIWFGILTRQALRRGSFNAVRALVETIDAFTNEWNGRPAPFVWSTPPVRSSQRPSESLERPRVRRPSSCRT
jgi:hypothetical protein